MKLSAALSVALALLAGAPADAAQGMRRVAVLEVRTVGTFDPLTVQGIATLVASEAQKLPIKVIAGSDIVTLIGYDRQRQLLGCKDSSCLAELGGALGVDFLLAPEVSEVGGVWLVSLALLDVARGTAVRRVTKKVFDPRGLIDAAQDATGEILAALPVRHGEAAAPPVATSTQRSSRWTAGVALDAAGGAILLAGAACGVVTLVEYNKAKTTQGSELASAQKNGKAAALAADVLYGTGAAAFVTGLILTLTAPSSSPGTAVSAAPIDRGGLVVVSGRF